MPQSIADIMHLAFGIVVVAIMVHVLAMSATFTWADLHSPKTTNAVCTCTVDLNCPFHGDKH